MYITKHATFDIYEHENGFNVILAPDSRYVSVGVGKYLATFSTPQEAQAFCDNWRPEDIKNVSRD